MPRASVDRVSHLGYRDKLITIERLTEGTANSNFPTEDFAQPYTVWAAKDYVSLEERVQSDRLMASAVVRWEVAYLSDLDPDRYDIAKTRRVKYMGRVYNIISAEMRSREQGQSIVLTTQAQAG